MGLWQFMDYCSEAGNNLIEEWYQDQSAAVQADFDQVLKTLSIAKDWRGMQEFKALGDGLCELRFKTGRVQYRPAGSFGPGRMTFSIWIGCKKKMNVYDPPDAFKRARKRRSLFEQGKGRLRERIV